MNIAFFTLSTILLILIFVVPGYLFSSILSRWSFPSGRENLNRFSSIISSIILSIIIILFFDTSFIQGNIEHLIRWSRHWNLDGNKLLSFFKESSLLKKTIEVLLKTSSINSHKEISSDFVLLFSISVLILMPFSFIFSISIVFFIYSLKKISMSKGASKIHSFLMIAIEGAYLRTINYCKGPDNTIVKIIPSVIVDAMAALKEFFLNPPLVFLKNKRLNIIYFFLIPLPFCILPRLTILILFEAFVMFLSLLYVLIIAAIVFLIPVRFVIYHLLALFQHHHYTKFFKFNDEFNLLIIEVLRNDHVLVKGIFDSFEPLNRSQLASVALSNVIQYKQKIKEGGLLEREKRDVYAFDNPNTLLAIPMGSVIDFNIWSLDIYNSNWKINVEDESSLINQIYYFDIIVKNNKVLFTKTMFNITCTDRLLFKLQGEIAKIIVKHFSTSFYESRKKELLLALFRDARRSLTLMVKDEVADPSLHSDLKTEYENLAKMIKKFYKEKISA